MMVKPPPSKDFFSLNTLQPFDFKLQGVVLWVGFRTIKILISWAYYETGVSPYCAECGCEETGGAASGGISTESTRQTSREAEVTGRKWQGRRWKGNLVRILSLNLAEVAPAGAANFTLVKKCLQPFRTKPTPASTQT